MSTDRFSRGFISQQEAKINATRQVLSFLRTPLPEAGEELFARSTAPSVNYFSIAFLPESALSLDGALFNWSSVDIYDAGNQLLFRDLFLELDTGIELRVRTAANTFLRSPVWSIKAGPAVAWQQLLERAMTFLNDNFFTPLQPVLYDGESAPRLVCYSYPKLGIATEASDKQRYIVDLGDLTIIPINVEWTQYGSESVHAIWSPYDTVNASNVSQYKALWEQNIAAMHSLPEAGAALFDIVDQIQMTVLEEVLLNPEIQLEAQETNVHCAVASAKMILRHYGLDKTQSEIAQAMRLGTMGATPKNQEAAIPVLSNRLLLATTDYSPSFLEGIDEIRANRPFKSAVAGHARVCSGFKIEGNGQRSYYINDPWPPGPNGGDTYFENVSALTYINQMYIRPALYKSIRSLS